MAHTVTISEFVNGWQRFYDRNLKPQSTGENMKITEIRIDRTKSLGNYENLKLGFTAVINEDESPVDAIDRVKKLLDWEINREERDAMFAKYTARLAEIEGLETDAAETERRKLSGWLDKYTALKTEVESEDVF